MSIPLDRLYHYIESVASEVCNSDVLIYRFFPHGSKKIEDLSPIKFVSWMTYKTSPEIICHDQEPLDYNAYQQTTIPHYIHTDASTELTEFLLKRNLRIDVGNVYDRCLLLHSEQRSAELKKYQNDQFIPVYYWSHAIIALDWFRYARFENFKKTTNKTFLVYNRAWTGTREYRIKFSDLLIEHDLVEHCQTNFNEINPDCHQPYQTHQYKNHVWIPKHQLENYFKPTDSLSTASADFDSNDYSATDFEVVLETLFDDQRLHLTEKSLRPIACKQPFILVATHGSLEYLRKYGFQTFNSVIDESYDLIEDPYQRMLAVINVMKQIANWSPTERAINMNKINAIVEFNHRHFFSNEFFKLVIDELKTNLNSAYNILESTNTGQRCITFDRFVNKELNIRPGIRQQRKLRIQNTIPGHGSLEDRLYVAKLIKKYRRNNRKNQQG